MCMCVCVCVKDKVVGRYASVHINTYVKGI